MLAIMNNNTSIQRKLMKVLLQRCVHYIQYFIDNTISFIHSIPLILLSPPAYDIPQIDKQFSRKNSNNGF